MLGPWKKSCDQPRQHIQKQRHYFANKDLSSQSYGFFSSHVWMWELDYKENWAPKNWCWRRLLRVPWTARRSNQSILKEIGPGISLEGVMLKLKLQYFGHLMRRVDSLERPWCWEGLRAGGKGDDRRWDGWIGSLTGWTWVWVDSRSWWWTGRSGVLRFMGSQRVGHNWAPELNWTKRNPSSDHFTGHCYQTFDRSNTNSIQTLSENRWQILTHFMKLVLLWFFNKRYYKCSLWTQM